MNSRTDAQCSILEHDRSIVSGCCNLTYNFSEVERPNWKLGINVDETVFLTPNFIETMLLYDSIKKALDGADSSNSDVVKAYSLGSRWSILRDCISQATGEPLVHLCCGPVSVFLPLIRMAQIFDDLKTVLISSLGKEPSLADYFADYELSETRRS